MSPSGTIGPPGRTALLALSVNSRIFQGGAPPATPEEHDGTDPSGRTGLVVLCVN